MYFKNNKGITLKSLTIVIIILAIIIGVAIYSLNKIIENQELESLKTNMLLIQAKSKEYCENAKTKLGVNPTDETKQNVKNYLEEIGSINYEHLGNEINKFNLENEEYLYLLTTNSFEKMGIPKIESSEEKGYYFVKFNINEETVEVYNTKGFTKDNVIYYSLSDIQQNL